MPNPWRNSEENSTEDPTQVGVSTPPGESVADQVQDKQAVTENTEEGEQNMSDNEQQVTVDNSAFNLEEPGQVDREPKQVEDQFVIYMPRKDFEARVNQEQMFFRSGVPTRVTRDVANMLLEDEDRGYVRD